MKYWWQLVERVIWEFMGRIWWQLVEIVILMGRIWWQFVDMVNNICWAGSNHSWLTEFCLALYCFVYLEDIGFVYPAMSLILIGPSLLYYCKTKSVQSAVWCLLTRIDDVVGRIEIPGIQSRIRTESFLFLTMNKEQKSNNKWMELGLNKINEQQQLIMKQQ